MLDAGSRSHRAPRAGIPQPRGPRKQKTPGSDHGSGVGVGGGGRWEGAAPGSCCGWRDVGGRDRAVSAYRLWWWLGSIFAPKSKGRRARGSRSPVCSADRVAWSPPATQGDDGAGDRRENPKEGRGGSGGGRPRRTELSVGSVGRRPEAAHCAASISCFQGTPTTPPTAEGAELREAGFCYILGAGRLPADAGWEEPQAPPSNAQTRPSPAATSLPTSCVASPRCLLDRERPARGAKALPTVNKGRKERRRREGRGGEGKAPLRTCRLPRGSRPYVPGPLLLAHQGHQARTPRLGRWVLSELGLREPPLSPLQTGRITRVSRDDDKEQVLEKSRSPRRLGERPPEQPARPTP